MDERLRNLAEGCVDAHKTQADTKEARKHFRINIQQAYDLGQEDALKASQKQPLKRDEPPAPNAGSNPPKPDPVTAKPELKADPAKDKGKSQPKPDTKAETAAPEATKAAGKTF